MTQFAVQRCISADLVLHFAAVAAGFVLYIKTLLCVMYTVRVSLLPVVLSFSAGRLLVAGRMTFTRFVVRSFLESLLLGDLTDVGIAGRHVG